MVGEYGYHYDQTPLASEEWFRQINDKRIKSANELMDL